MFGDSTNSTRGPSVAASISKGGKDVFDITDITNEQESISVGALPRPKSRAETKNRVEVVIDGVRSRDVGYVEVWEVDGG